MKLIYLYLAISNSRVKFDDIQVYRFNVLCKSGCGSKSILKKICTTNKRFHINTILIIIQHIAI